VVGSAAASAESDWIKRKATAAMTNAFKPLLNCSPEESRKYTHPIGLGKNILREWEARDPLLDPSNRGVSVKSAAVVNELITRSLEHFTVVTRFAVVQTTLKGHNP
jgi:hypothetical protein